MFFFSCGRGAIWDTCMLTISTPTTPQKLGKLWSPLSNRHWITADVLIVDRSPRNHTQLPRALSIHQSCFKKRPIPFINPASLSQLHPSAKESKHRPTTIQPFLLTPVLTDSFSNCFQTIFHFHSHARPHHICYLYRNSLPRERFTLACITRAVIHLWIQEMVLMKWTAEI